MSKKVQNPKTMEGKFLGFFSERGKIKGWGRTACTSEIDVEEL